MTGNYENGEPNNELLLGTLEHLLALEAAGLDEALAAAADLIAAALRADKVDAFMHTAGNDTLVAAGTSNTPMGRKQRALGLDHLPVSIGGRIAKVFLCGETFITGHASDDPEELPGLVDALGVRSAIAAPLLVNGQRRGVLAVASGEPEFFAAADARFVEAAARWIGMVAGRAEAVERIAEDAAEQARQIAARELITVLAHDLRNYITPLKLRIDMMRRKAQREERAGDLSDINDAASAVRRLDTLIGDLLDAGLLEQGAYSVDLQPLDLAALVRETVAIQRVQTTGIVVDAPDELPVHGDAARLQQALENLLSNAVQHAPAETHVEVTVGHETRDDTQWAVVTVRDRGPGIAPSVMPKLFQRFASGPGSTGLGLGLYIASRIAAAHDGELTVNSTPGHGAAFRLTIPMA